MEERIISIEQNVETISKELKEFRTSTASALNQVVGILNSLQVEIKELDVKLKSLDNNTADGLNDVSSKIKTLTEEITKIGAVTGYDEMYNNQSGLK